MMGEHEREDDEDNERCGGIMEAKRVLTILNVSLDRLHSAEEHLPTTTIMHAYVGK